MVETLADLANDHKFAKVSLAKITKTSIVSWVTELVIKLKLLYLCCESGVDIL